MITALLVDDELHNIHLLQSFLKEHCTQIHVIDAASSADEAYMKINLLKPQLVFLDVVMPLKSGFDLLRMYKTYDFEVIFVSAFNEFAIHAFEFNAIDYLLKPIDYTLLIKAVDRAEKRFFKSISYSNLLLFMKTIDEMDDAVKKISIHKNDKVHLINIDDIAYIEANTEYCSISLLNKEKYTSSKRLALFENLLKPNSKFIRINKSIILNIECIKSYTKGEPCVIEMKSGRCFEVSRRKKSEINVLLNKF